MPPRSCLLAALPFVLVAACSTADSTPAAQPAATVASAGGDSPLSDSLLARADSARIMGTDSAPIWMLEISDFQCPFCRQFHEETYPTIIRDYVQTGKVRLAYVNFPLEMHQHAMIASEAAMCAAAQGPQEFWRYHDLLFQAQEKWESIGDVRPLFDSLAVQAGIQQAPFDRCLETHAMRPMVQADRDRMAAAGVRSTPTFFIGDTRVEGAQPVETFRRAIDAALAAKGAGSGS